MAFEARGKSPFQFLVIGCGRGGTSLLTGLLDSHPGLGMGFELFAVDCLMGKGLPRLDKVLPWRKSRLIERRIRAFKNECDRMAGKSSKQIWGNKITTEHLHGLEDHNQLNPRSRVDIIDLFFRRSEELKIIFILRDGRTCVKSKVRRTGQTIEQACLRWKFSVKVYQYLQKRHAGSLIVKYEDLLREPEEVLARVCGFLGVPFDASMMGGTDSPLLPPEYRHAGILKSKLDDEIAPADWHALIMEELRACGYA